MATKKKTTKRSRSQYPNLDPRLNTKIRQELIAVDYLHKLSPEELEWLNKFNGEYVNANFNQDGTDLDGSKAGRKASYDRNNARNRDLYGLINSRSLGKMMNLDLELGAVENELHRNVSHDAIENSYLDFIDGLEVKEIMKEYVSFMTTYSEDCE